MWVGNREVPQLDENLRKTVEVLHFGQNGLITCRWQKTLGQGHTWQAHTLACADCSPSLVQFQSEFWY